MKPTILIVDDDEEIRTQMKWALSGDHNVLIAGDRTEAIEQFQTGYPQAVLLDLGLPPRPNDSEEGLATLSALLALDSALKVIIVSGQAEKENALRAVGAGAYDFLCKPVDTGELQLVLRRCLYLDRLEREFRRLQQNLKPNVFEGMLASSPEMHSIFDMIRKVAKSSAPVLVLGESGTGKEMVARAIHRQSDRKAKPFVAINCSAIPENLIESELFGHEKGSFTGADKQRKGLIEGAEDGTLFLDEIGDLPAAIQVKLLRFLQDKRLQRVGGREEIQIDTRIVAATNANLKQSIVDGKFREDLYFRLAVVVLSLPPLRQRAGDAVALARDFLVHYAAENGRKDLVLAPETLHAIASHAWPGNVRELQNRIQRAAIMADGNRIRINDMELPAAPPGITLREAREALERDLLQRALATHSGKITAAAKELGISRPTFYELMDKLGLEKVE
ncbi:MAG: PEP-CTERM-box response regulator transcription factor [Verrucomicrobiaceae bacterium]|nr:MAG: PEP-CTERM-box response regulator transcription factor [Verrucomicrobiaceae bacterium]